MKNIILLFLVCLSGFAQAADFPPARELLETSDRSRGAAASTKGISWEADITAVENGEKKDTSYAIRVRGNDALAEVTAPARQKGELMLFNDRTIWFFKPGIKKPINISPRQKLMGQAANGDIASTQYARDYEGTVTGEEIIGGQPTWRMELKARAKNVTYDKIVYWVSQSERLGLKADFLTLSGEVFKSAEFQYEKTITLQGKQFPFVSRMIIRDALNIKNETIINYRSPREEEHGQGIFNVNNLIR